MWEQARPVRLLRLNCRRPVRKSSSSSLEDQKTLQRFGFATGTCKTSCKSGWRVDHRQSCSVDGLRQGTSRRPVGVRYRCTSGRHRYSEDEAHVMRCGRRSRGLPDTEARVSPNPRSFAEDSWRNVYAGELEVRPPGAPTTRGLGHVSRGAPWSQTVGTRV